MANELFSQVTLPCGRTIPNRLVKVAMYEHLANLFGGPPNAYHFNLYSAWSKQKWGMVITGNVQVCPEHLSLGRDMVIPREVNEDTLEPFAQLARSIHGTEKDYSSSREPCSRALAIMQISHAGRQSPNFLGGRKPLVPPLAPSPVRLGSSRRTESVAGATVLEEIVPPLPLRALFQIPREMTVDDIKDVQQAFVRASLTAMKSGFDGVQLHCAHGYLLSQFLNPKSNLRKDAYSCAPENELRMVREIVDAIRAVVPQDFVVGLKINSADYLEADERPSDYTVTKEMNRVLSHIRSMAHWGTIDFIEISGGDYESPDFLSTKVTTPRQAFFEHFSKTATKALESNPAARISLPSILLTGGLRSPAHLQMALDARHAHLFGFGRSSVIRPDLPTVLRERIERSWASGGPMSIASDDEPFVNEPDSRMKSLSWFPDVKLIGATMGIAWYVVRIRRIAQWQMHESLADGKSGGLPPFNYNRAGIPSMLEMWIWMDWSSTLQAFVVFLVAAYFVFLPPNGYL
ncbi:hypothetical protein F5I97DRAFT_1073482 [Phlebopus sp. FC_14]|nr:hypothetical protein F5I97DRAFT_1073482 [Phlebopus sp. FC_14]